MGLRRILSVSGRQDCAIPTAGIRWRRECTFTVRRHMPLMKPYHGRNAGRTERRSRAFGPLAQESRSSSGVRGFCPVPVRRHGSRYLLLDRTVIPVPTAGSRWSWRSGHFRYRVSMIVAASPKGSIFGRIAATAPSKFRRGLAYGGRPGAYSPVADKDLAAWKEAEETTAAPAMACRLESVQPGDQLASGGWASMIHRERFP